MGDKGAEYMLTRPFETQPIDFCGSGAHGDGLCDGLPVSITIQASARRSKTIITST